jgi:uncharacterized protein (TIGR02270 family)
MSKTDFIKSLYIDQLESISFLHGQRLTLLLNPEVSWKEISKFEERFEANLDALVTGGEQALESCRQQAAEGDAGELHAAVRVFCRQGRKDLFLEVLEHIDPQNEEKLQALVDALKHELPIDWQDDFSSLLQSDDEQLCALVASVVGYRRIPAGRDLVRALRKFQPAPVIWALGRLREQSAVSLLLAALGNDNEAVCSATALGLLRMGERQAVEHCLAVAGEKPWAVIPLALGGGRSAVPVMLDIARSDQTDQDSLLALGLLGDSSAVDLLLAKLTGDFDDSAALALNLITGAELYERVFIAEKVEEDELFPEELAAYQREGKAPTKSDGTPYGEWVTRLSQNPAAWHEWWRVNRQRFAPGVRYRNGRPFSPACLLENLQNEKSPHRIRQLAYEELVIRYDVDFSFEADLFVDAQLRILNDMAQWVISNDARFQAGAWYFAGQIVR